MKFLFDSTVILSEKFMNHYWIESDIIKRYTIEGTCLKEALNYWVTLVQKESWVKITPSALKNKLPMMIDLPDGSFKQIGYVITGHVDIDGKDIIVNIWVKIDRIEKVNFEED